MHKKETFGFLDDDRAADIYTLKNSNGAIAKITNYGGIVVSLEMPDKNGNFEDVVLGYDRLDEYLEETPYFGALVGRFANRIANAGFSIDGQCYKLAQNNGPNHLHGGMKGFDKVLWSVELKDSLEGVVLELSYLSEDGEENYPGNLNCKVVYTLTDSNELVIDYEARTDKPTIVNLTNHSYFNLSGNAKKDILNHELMIDADSITAVDDNLIPTGELVNVKDSALDFRATSKIGSRISEVKGGYDHNYVLNKPSNGQLFLVATIYDAESGRLMEVKTTEPGVQFYSGNFLVGSIIGKGVKYEKHWGLCLETQHFPDSPNQPNFPSVILRPGQKYRQTTIYKFLTK